jgi:hypothetical protein
MDMIFCARFHFIRGYEIKFIPAPVGEDRYSYLHPSGQVSAGRRIIDIYCHLYPRHSCKLPLNQINEV